MMQAIRATVRQPSGDDAACHARSPHKFHIPVMGTGFTIDTPLKVGRYGIDSCISLVDDELIEQLRSYHSSKSGEPYTKIPHKEPDHRALRITAYLNLLDRLVKKQAQELAASPFRPGSEITRYFSLLPDGPARQAYQRMLCSDDQEERERLEGELRAMLAVGKIDVNIMTKLDSPSVRKSVPSTPEQLSAMSAFRGFALSDLDASIVFSAGLNQRLYAYVAKFDDFFPDANGHLKKRIILKVSDFRSALIQGQYLAKRGLWVSEFRIESGINCGGHAFSARASLLGNVLWEFKERREELSEKLSAIWQRTLVAKERVVPEQVPGQRLTAQGGLLTGREQRYLLETFELDGVGWGTPFLLVPEVTNLDAEHRLLLIKAKSRDVLLSQSSPLGVPFWTLRQSASEQLRRHRIKRGEPGSPCTKGYCILNTELKGNALCTASRVYQRRKLEELEGSQLSRWLRRGSIKMIKAKTCICNDLGGGVQRQLGLDAAAPPSVCCGPSIAYFKQLATLDTMTDHIYERAMLLKHHPQLHLFTRELLLYIRALRDDVLRFADGQWQGKPVELEKIRTNLRKQIESYSEMIESSALRNKDRYRLEAARALRSLERIPLGRAIKRYLSKEGPASL